MRRKLLFAGVMLLFTLALGEGAARVLIKFMPNKQSLWRPIDMRQAWSGSQYARHPYLNYMPRPGFNKQGRKHNSHGLRGEEIAMPKPRGLYRVVIVGGSTTYTDCVDDNAKAWPAQVQTVLHEKFGHGNVEIINAGCPGYNTWHSLVNLNFRLLDLDPDLLIVHHNINDVSARLVHPQHYRGDGSGARKPWTLPEPQWWEKSCALTMLAHHLGDGSKKTTRFTIWECVEAPTSAMSIDTPEYCQRIGGKPMDVLQQNPPTYFERNLRNMVAAARAHGVDVMLSTWANSDRFNNAIATAHYQKGIAEHNDVICRVAAELDTHLYDFAKEMSPQKQYWVDGSHVNEAGAALKGELFAKHLDGAGLFSHKAALQADAGR